MDFVTSINLGGKGRRKYCDISEFVLSSLQTWSMFLNNFQLVVIFGKHDMPHSLYTREHSTNSHKCIFFFFFADKTITIVEPCPTKTSVLALGITCMLLILIYVSTVFCYYMKKWMTPRKMMA